MTKGFESFYVRGRGSAFKSLVLVFFTDCSHWCRAMGSDSHPTEALSEVIRVSLFQSYYIHSRKIYLLLPGCGGTIWRFNEDWKHTETGQQQEVEMTKVNGQIGQYKKNLNHFLELLFLYTELKKRRREKHLEWQQQQQLGFRQLRSSLHGEWKHEEQNAPTPSAWWPSKKESRTFNRQPLISAFSSYRVTTSGSHRHFSDHSRPSVHF